MPIENREFSRPAVAFTLFLSCKKCEKGDMRKVDAPVLMSHPPQFRHECTACGAVENITDNYPKFSHRGLDADKVLILQENYWHPTPCIPAAVYPIVSTHTDGEDVSSYEISFLKRNDDGELEQVKTVLEGDYMPKHCVRTLIPFTPVYVPIIDEGRVSAYAAALETEEGDTLCFETQFNFSGEIK